MFPNYLVQVAVPLCPHRPEHLQHYRYKPYIRDDVARVLVLLFLGLRCLSFRCRPTPLQRGGVHGVLNEGPGEGDGDVDRYLIVGVIPVPLPDVADDVLGASGPVGLAREHCIHRYLHPALQLTRVGLVVRVDGVEARVLEAVVTTGPLQIAEAEGVMTKVSDRFAAAAQHLTVGRMSQSTQRHRQSQVFIYLNERVVACHLIFVLLWAIILSLCGLSLRH